VPFFVESLKPRPIVAVGKNDYEVWRDGGGSKYFGYKMELPQDPDQLLSPGDVLKLGDHSIEIREVPGHSPGSIVLYIPDLRMAICGDAIFKENIGRTDLKDGNQEQLLDGIQSQIFTLPDDTLLIPGHGESTTVGHEKLYNPFLN
jgi:glyoxylase-like metal-dependent hydrolase (beta-lactamase superfamily II)